MPSKTPAAGDSGDPNKKIRVRRHFVRADYNVLENAVFDIDNRSDSKTLAVVKTIRRGNDTIISSWIARSERAIQLEMMVSLPRRMVLTTARVLESERLSMSKTAFSNTL